MRENYIDKSRDLTHREAQAMISDYLDDKLSERDLAAFLRHIGACGRCYHDLETDFMVEQTVRYLNSDDMRTLNLAPALRENIREKTKELLRKRRMRKVRIAILVVTLILGTLLVLDLTGVFRVTIFVRMLLGM